MCARAFTRNALFWMENDVIHTNTSHRLLARVCVCALCITTFFLNIYIAKQCNLNYSQSLLNFSATICFIYNRWVNSKYLGTMQFEEHSSRNDSINGERRRYKENVNIYFWTSVLNGNSLKSLEIKLRLTKNRFLWFFFCTAFCIHRTYVNTNDGIISVLEGINWNVV